MDDYDQDQDFHTVEHPPPPKERRFKLSRACDRCRRRRIKCDEGHPCQSCISSNAPCTFEETGKRSHPHKSKRTASLEDRLQHLESLIQAIPSNIFAPGVLSSPASGTGGGNYPLGVPPPSLSTFPLANPSLHFAIPNDREAQLHDLVEATSKLSLTHSYLYLDDQGSTRWQGECSGLPLLDVLLEEDRQYRHEDEEDEVQPPANPTERGPRQEELNPGAVWRAVTAVVPPDLMDSLVQVYLSTSHYLYPFLHVPTFLADYSNPVKWGEPGFATFVLGICALASRHTDDPRVRADANDPLSAGTHFLELFHRLRSSSGVPGIDRPSLYSIQAALTAAVYCIGLGRLSRGAALIAEAITLSIDVGLHRSTEQYDEDWFDARELEARSRTFWAVYCWDKQLASAFGRPPLLRLRDCDARPPHPVSDEYITSEGILPPTVEVVGHLPNSAEAFLYATRIYVVLESVSSSVAPLAAQGDPFLSQAAKIMTTDSHHNLTHPPSSPIDISMDAHNNSPDNIGAPPRAASAHMLYAEEALLDAIARNIPRHWAPTAETLGSPDVLRVTQATRVLCMEQFVRMLIHRHRLGICVARRASTADGDDHQHHHHATPLPHEVEREAVRGCQQAAVTLVAAHLSVASKGLMTYYGVHVIHQLTQAGRSLLAVLLECQHFINDVPAQPQHTQDNQTIIEYYRSLIPPSIDALRSCLGLLRRFSGRYVCGLRSADLIEECCRRTRIPLDVSASDASGRSESILSRSRRPWLRPVKRRTGTGTGTGTRAGSRTRDEQQQQSNSGSSQSPESKSPSASGSTSYMHTAVPTQQTMNLLASDAPANGAVATGAFLSNVNLGGAPPGMDAMEYAAMDGGIGLDMSALDIMALLSGNYEGGLNLGPPPPGDGLFYGGGAPVLPLQDAGMLR